MILKNQFSRKVILLLFIPLQI